MNDGKRSTLPDPSEDLRVLWIATHDYLVAQARAAEGSPELGHAYTNLVHVHNDVHRRYFAAEEAGEPVAGVATEPDEAVDSAPNG